MKVFLRILFLILLFHTFSGTVNAEGTYSQLGTPISTDGSVDSINFSQGRPLVIDKFGKYILMTEGRVSSTHRWAWSNNAGTNWSEGTEGYGFLNRAAITYSTIDDVLHVIWNADASTDGVIYRRYSISRDGSNNITNILRMDSGSVNLQLDTSSSCSISEPAAIWVDNGSAHGIIVASWTKGSCVSARTLVSMRSLSMTSADGVAGNWVAPDGTADVIGSDAPAVASDVVFDAVGTFRGIPSIGVRGGNGVRKDDLYLFYTSDENSNIFARRAIWNGTNSNWSGGWQASISVGEFNASAGYNLKDELLTKPVIDVANDRLYIGWARWVTGGAGDTVSFAYLDASDTPSATYDVYSSNGVHSYAPTIDIAYDELNATLYASYIESTTNGDNGSINYKTFSSGSLSSATRFYSSPGGSSGENGAADIPIMYPYRTSNDRLIFLYRVNGALPPTVSEPHQIYWGYIPLTVPTPTPTPTPTPSPSATPTPTPSTEVITISPSYTPATATPPQCQSSTPKMPEISKITKFSSNSIMVTITPATDTVTDYNAMYGFNNNNLQYGAVSLANGNASQFFIGSLPSFSSVSLKINASNGCAVSEWSKIFTFSQPNSGNIQNILSPSNLTPLSQQIYIEPQSSIPSSTPTPTPTPTQSPLDTIPNEGGDKRGILDTIFVWLKSLFRR